ncbi:hypothetical protein ES703_75134 [subsurface metagenome]
MLHMAVHPIELDGDTIDIDCLLLNLHLPETDTAAKDLCHFSLCIQ